MVDLVTVWGWFQRPFEHVPFGGRRDVRPESYLGAVRQLRDQHVPAVIEDEFAKFPTTAEVAHVMGVSTARAWDELVKLSVSGGSGQLIMWRGSVPIGDARWEPV